MATARNPVFPGAISEHPTDGGFDTMIDGPPSVVAVVGHMTSHRVLPTRTSARQICRGALDMR